MYEILTPIVGSENINTIDGVLYVTPTSQEQMAQVVKLCYQNCWKINIQGQGSKSSWGKQGGLVLSTAKLDRLIDHAVGDLTVTIEAGFRFQALQNLLSNSQQCLGIDPPYPEKATLGGIVATGDSGSLRHRYNSVRDQILGIKFIRSDGEIVKAGGRVVKNVAGYDLMKLLTSSYGTLGIITEVTFRLYPLPSPKAFWLCQGEDEKIATLRSVLLNSALTPQILDLYSPYLLQSLGHKYQWGIGIEFAGISTEFQGNLLNQITHNLGVSCQLMPENFTQNIRTKFETYGRCKIGIPSDRAIQVLDPAYPWQIHLGSGLGLGLITENGQISTLRQKFRELGGFLTVLVGEYPDRCYLEPSIKKLMTQVKTQFDPKGILNPMETSTFVLY